MSIDWDKPLQTRNGCEVRIYARDCGTLYAHGAFKYSERDWRACAWNRDGQSWGNFSDDLVNVPEPEEVWLNYYGGREPKTYKGYAYSSKEEADKGRSGDRILIHLTIKGQEVKAEIVP